MLSDQIIHTVSKFIFQALSSTNSKNIQGTVESLLKALLKFQLISESLVLVGNHYNEVIAAQREKYTQLKLLE